MGIVTQTEFWPNELIFFGLSQKQTTLKILPNVYIGIYQ